MPDVLNLVFWIVGIGIAFVILMASRTFVLWYFGILETHRNQEETNKLLRIIANQNRPKNPAP